MNKLPGSLFVIAAPSGAGKTSLVKALVEKTPDLQVSISHTTRPMRKGEQDGVNYFFVDQSRFVEMVEQDDFLEHATVYGNQYGTSRAWVLSHLSKGVDVILEIDWQGARQVHSLFPEAVLIFILPPSMAALRERLEGRRQDDADTIARRMHLARNETMHYSEFEYLVVNDGFDDALADLRHIVCAHRLKTDVQVTHKAQLLESLLKND